MLVILKSVTGSSDNWVVRKSISWYDENALIMLSFIPKNLPAVWQVVGLRSIPKGLQSGKLFFPRKRFQLYIQVEKVTLVGVEALQSTYVPICLQHQNPFILARKAS